MDRHTVAVRDHHISLWLFLMFLTLNLLDIAISMLAVGLGGVEVGIIYKLTQNFYASLFIKGLLMFLFGGFLFLRDKKFYLALSCVFMLAVCAFNGQTLAHLM